VQLSTSQWVAVLTAVPAAIAYGIYFKAAQAHPESAMALNLEEFYKLHPEAVPGAAPEKGEAQPEKAHVEPLEKRADDEGAPSATPVAADEPKAEPHA
jgi:hypothetical protein